MKPAYILIDFENVQPDKIGALDTGQFKIKVFVGAKQSRVKVGLASALQPMGNAVEYIRIEGSGRNAVDFHVAYYIGRLSVEEPGAVFHILSEDTGFDPLIDHLKGKKIHCHRWSSFGHIPHAHAPAPKAAARPAAKPKPLPKVATKSTPVASPRADEIADNLVKRARARPSTLKALASTIKSHFRGVGMTDQEVDGIVDTLTKRGLIAVKDGKVTYRLG